MGQRIVRITGVLLTEMFTHGWCIPHMDGIRVECCKGLPKDARLIDADFDIQCNLLVLKFESAEWEATKPGAVVESFDAQFRIVQAEKPVEM